MTRILCWLGWHRWTFYRRYPAGGRYYFRLDECARCPRVRARSEWI